MKVSREQMQANRTRILDAAGRLFREKGFEAVGVAEVMKAAGLTHGGFYGHFASKDDLIAQSVGYVFLGGGVRRSAGGTLDAWLDDYLSPTHRDGVAEGCPTAALVTDIRRQTPEARQAMTEGFRGQINRLERAMSETPDAGSRQDAIGAFAAMVGAMVLARAIDDPALSDEVLRETRAWISAR